MTTKNAFEAGFIPHNNPCAQCLRPIGSPLFWEVTEHGVDYIWRCEACDYEFTAFAMHPNEDDQRVAA